MGNGSEKFLLEVNLALTKQVLVSLSAHALHTKCKLSKFPLHCRTMADKAKMLDNAIESAIRNAVVDYKVNACPMAVRLAWHSSGTFDKKDGSGGSSGATMRFEPESTDDANAGLNIMRDLLIPVKKQFPFLSIADIWTRAGAFAVRFSGGPSVPFEYGRTDARDGRNAPPNGRLPDAAQGAQHLRDIFYRMGFNDREIVCLSGAHTLGRCHKSRSGFDGPWTANPLKFDNSYFKNLMGLDWKPRKWDGPLQYEDPSGKYMMLPSDMALKTDESFRVFAQRYADDEQLFFKDFAAVSCCVMSCVCRASLLTAGCCECFWCAPLCCVGVCQAHVLGLSCQCCSRQHPHWRSPSSKDRR